MTGEKQGGVGKASSPMGDELPFIPFTSTWSLANGFGACDLDSTRQLPPEFGSQQISFRSFGAGAGMFDISMLFTEPVNVTGTVISNSPFLLLRLPLSGLVELKSKKQGSLTETDMNYGAFTLDEAWSETTISPKQNIKSQVIAPMISLDRLRNMLDGIRKPPVIESFLDGCDDPFFATPRMSMAMRRLTRQILESPTTAIWATCIGMENYSRS